MVQSIKYRKGVARVGLRSESECIRGVKARSKGVRGGKQAGPLSAMLRSRKLSAAHDETDRAF